ncbi:hypothetical protein EJB05_49278, partial [Eragrostis curvula]
MFVGMEHWRTMCLISGGGESKASSLMENKVLRPLLSLVVVLRGHAYGLVRAWFSLTFFWMLVRFVFSHDEYDGGDNGFGDKLNDGKFIVCVWKIPHLVPQLHGFTSPQGLLARRNDPCVVDYSWSLPERKPLQLSASSTPACIMFDGMPAQKRGKEDEGAPAEAGGLNSLDTLPDALLHHVLSFLPAEETVRTSVLARRWRHLWKSAPGLRIGCLRDHEPVSVATLRRFVDYLLLLRGASPLDRCELRIGDCFEDEEDRTNCVNVWTPVLESMPSLVEAFVRVTDCCDRCDKLCDAGQDCNCEYCDSGGIGNGSSVLLKGLSKARKLVLISTPQMGPKHKMEMKGTFSSRKRSTAISGHLEIVEIKCEVVDERVFKVLKFLCTFNISKLT